MKLKKLFITIIIIIATSPNLIFAPDFNKADKDFLDMINPMKIASEYDSESTDKSDQLSTPGGIINELLIYLFPLAILILFAMLVWGGFEMLTGAANEKNLTAGKNRVTSAIAGFILLFASYWIVEIVQNIFNIQILST